MDTSLLVILSPNGCFSSSRNVAFIQRDTQSYHKELRNACEADQRKRVIRIILGSSRLTPTVRAAIECYMYAYLAVSQWHVLRDDRKTAVVEEFYDNVWSNARAQYKRMATVPTTSGENKAVELQIAESFFNLTSNGD